MRVLALFHAFPPHHNAGAEWMALSLFEPLIQRGHEVTVRLSRRPGKRTKPFMFRGVKILPPGKKNELVELVPKYDIVVSHLENTHRGHVLAKMFGKPHVQLIHNTHHLTASWLKHCDLAVFNSVWMADEFRHAGVVLPSHSIVVRPPVHRDDYATTPGGCVTLINLNCDKGAGVFWELAQRLPDTPFLGVKGSYGPQVIKRRPNVTVMPNTTDMRRVYSRTKLLLMPSVYESWGRVGVEAMCSGIPVIAHPTPGLRESLSDAGVFVNRDDIDAWEKTVRHLLTPHRWKAVSQHAQHRAAELDPTVDLACWVDAVETLGGVS